MPPKILVPVTCALACGAIAALSSLGWLLGVPHLVSVFPGAPRMVPMTAALMILLALALAREAGTLRTVPPTALACAFVTTAALALLVSHALHRVSAPFVFGGDHQVVRGDIAEVCVEDNGIGIDAALLPRVFDSFTQATRTAGRAEGGLGLGLALVRRLAELHGGDVGANSAGPGQGSTFVLTLPCLPVDDAPDEDGSSAASLPRIC